MNKKTFTILYDIAYKIALEAHKDQYDLSGLPYIGHVLEVSKNCKSQDGKIAGLLHDVLEDSKFTRIDLLKAGIPEYIVEAVVILSKDKTESYENYLERIKTNALSIEVKISDLEHNLDIKRLPSINENSLKRIQKYHKAYTYLLNFI